MITRLKKLDKDVEELTGRLKELRKQKLKTVETVMSEMQEGKRAVDLLEVKIKLTDVKAEVEDLTLETERCSVKVQQLTSKVEDRWGEVERKKRKGIFSRFRRLNKHKRK